jgi:hypothetical protein
MVQSNSSPTNQNPNVEEIVFAPALGASPMRLVTVVRGLTTRPELQKTAKIFRDRASWPSILSYAQALALCRQAGVL